jgi:hypothetical protein
MIFSHSAHAHLLGICLFRGKILSAVLNPVFSKTYPSRPVALVVGFDKNGKTIEVAYDIETRTIFHAMPSKGLKNRT